MWADRSQDGHRKPLNFERNPPEGQRCKLMQNKVRSQMSLIFQSRGLRHLERALQARHRRAQSLAREIPTVPEALKAKLSLGHVTKARGYQGHP